MSPEQLVAHNKLQQVLKVRTVRCYDYEDETEPTPLAEEPVVKRSNGNCALAKTERLSVIQRAEISERRMLSKMRAGTWYSAKHLSALAGMQEKCFYTHVRRMVVRGQLVRSGTRHWFRYRKT